MKWAEIEKRVQELEIKNNTITHQAEELTAYNEALNELNNKLEIRVNERTTELVEKNKILSEHYSEVLKKNLPNGEDKK